MYQLSTFSVSKEEYKGIHKGRPIEEALTAAAAIAKSLLDNEEKQQANDNYVRLLCGEP